MSFLVDNNRVRLRQQSKSNGDAVTEEDDGDYINASPIQYDNTNTKYICNKIFEIGDLQTFPLQITSQTCHIYHI